MCGGECPDAATRTLNKPDVQFQKGDGGYMNGKILGRSGGMASISAQAEDAIDEEYRADNISPLEYLPGNVTDEAPND